MKSVEQHTTDLLGLVEPLEPIRIELLRAQGGVLAEDVTAPVSLPQFDNSAMDGYALVAADVAEAGEDTPVRLPVIADIPAGDPGTHAIRSGMCARIMTGAPMPAGADAVVPVEWTDGGVAEVLIRGSAPVGNAVRPAGGDVEKGAEVLQNGVRVGAAEIAVLAAVGHPSALVHPRPRVAVLSTGEELVEPGAPIGPGQIWESNAYMLTAAAIEVGCAAFRHGFTGDDPSTVLATLDDVLPHADLVVTTGGVSMGAYDVVKEALAQLDTVRFEQVAVQPGKPQGAGTVHGTPIVALPGNPVSAFVSFHLFVRPMLAKMGGMPPEGMPALRARLAEPVTDSPRGRRSYLRAQLDHAPEDGGHAVRPISRQGSHQLSALASADALIVVDEAVTDLPAGSIVDVLRLP